MSTVAVTQNPANIGKAMHEALDFFEIEPLISGRRVAIKPNETWASPHDTTAVTQPDTLRAMLRYVKRFGPRELIVTGGAGAAETGDVFTAAGLMSVVEEEGAQFFDHNRQPFVEVDLKYHPELDVAGPQKTVVVNPRVLEYETLVSLSQIKLHGTATVTMAMKNIAMSFPAADYYGHPRSRQVHENYFYEDMHSFIVAMSERFPIDLAVNVGHPAMIGTGPIGGHAVETGIVIASTDAVAADVVGARLLGFWPQAVRYLWEAGLLGLGETDIDAIHFPAMDMIEAIQAFTSAVYGKKMNFRHA